MDDFSTNGYDPHRIYAGTTNMKGFSSRLRIAVPPEVMSLAGELAATRKLDGIKTATDVFRDALVHRLHTYKEMLDTSDPMLARRMLAASERMRVDIALEDEIRVRNRDHEAADRACRLLYDQGKSALPLAREALATIRTDEYSRELERDIDRCERNGS